MISVVMRWMVLTVAVWIAATIVPGIDYDGWSGLFIAAMVLGILNSFVKPLLQILSFPFILLSLGLFLLIINAILLGLTAWLVPGFSISGFWPAVGGSLVVSIVSMFLGYSGGRSPGPGRPRIIINRPDAPREGPGVPPGKGPIIDV